MKGSRSIVVLVLVASLMIVGACVLWYSFRVSSLRRRAALIKPGDDKNHVRSVLGRPAVIYGGPECWAYESPLHGWNWHRPAGDFPWIVSLNLSLGPPDTNDVLVYFNAARVARVYIPLQ